MGDAGTEEPNVTAAARKSCTSLMYSFDDALEAELDSLLALTDERCQRRLARIALVAPGQATRLRAMLKAIDASQSFLSLAPRAETAADLPGAEPHTEGELIDVWRLVREIGGGGMGSVWLAERADGTFKKQVAIKFIIANDAKLRKRLNYERHLLATLTHPAIARLLDGGMTAANNPYFVADYVDGLPIDAWCDLHRPDLHKRLELFRSVCAAVAYAHDRQVIHCDIKPGNILIDAEGQAWLLDFGVARLNHLYRNAPATEAGAPSDANSMSTDADTDAVAPPPADYPLANTYLNQATHSLVGMTLQFATPEQLDPNAAQRYGTHTDVYALGNLLYLLLAGQPALDTRGMSFAELVQIITKVVPAFPPRGTALEDRARNAPARLFNDLGHIALKALSKNPQDRYERVEDLLADVDNATQHRPLVAAPPDRMDRLRRFVRRNWVTAALSLTIGVGVAIGGVQTYRAVLASRQSEQAAQATRAANDMLLSMLKDASPLKNQGRTLSAEDLIERGVKEYNAKFDDQPELQLAVGDSLINTLLEFGKYAPALDLGRKSLAIAEELYGADSLIAHQKAVQLGNIFTLNKWADDKIVGRLDRAVAYFQGKPEDWRVYTDALITRAALLSLSDPRGPRIDRDLDTAIALVSTGEDDVLLLRALAMKQRAHAMRRVTYQTPAAIASFFKLSTDLFTAIKKVGVARQTEVLTEALDSLAFALTKTYRYDDAEDILQTQLRLRRALVGEGHPTADRSLEQLVTSYLEQGKYAAAKAIVNLQLKYAAQTPDDWMRNFNAQRTADRVAVALNDFPASAAYRSRAANFALMGKNSALEKQFKIWANASRANDVNIAEYGTLMLGDPPPKLADFDHYRVGVIMFFGRYLRYADRPGEALKWLQRAYDRNIAHVPHGTEPDLLFLVNQLAQAYRDLGGPENLEKAQRLLEPVLIDHRPLLPPAGQSRREAEIGLATIKLARGTCDEEGMNGIRQYIADEFKYVNNTGHYRANLAGSTFMLELCRTQVKKQPLANPETRRLARQVVNNLAVEPFYRAQARALLGKK